MPKAIRRQATALLLSIAALILVSLAAVASSRPTEVTVVFRYDDYSYVSDTAVENRMIDVFARHKAALTVGVIPFICVGDPRDMSDRRVLPLGPEKAAVLKRAADAGTVEVALHGYSHRAVTGDARVRSAEFSGADYDAQVALLAQGRAYLDGLLDVEITTFIPPWNRYDDCALRALETLSFDCISASMAGKAGAGSTLKFVPSTCGLPGLRKAVERARREAGKPMVVVLMHPYDFTEIDKERGVISVDLLDEIVEWAASQGDVRIRTVGRAALVMSDLGAERYLGNRANFTRPSFLAPPPLVSRLRPAGVYSSSETAARLASRTLAFAAAFYLALALVCATLVFLAGNAVAPRLARLRSLRLCAFGVVIIAIAAFGLGGVAPNFTRVASLAAALGATIGIFWSARAREERAILSRIHATGAAVSTRG